MGALRLLRSHRELLGLSGVNFVAFVAHEVLPSVFVLYAGYRYGWGERAVGLTLAAVGACAAFVQIVLVKPMVERFGDRGVLLIGLAFGAAGFAIYGIAQTGAVFCIGIPVMSIWGMSGAAVQSLMTRHVGADEQGRLQGAQSSVTGIAGLIGPGLFTIVFARSIDPHGGWNTPGAAFELSAALIVVALILGSYVTRGSKRDEVPSTTG